MAKKMKKETAKEVTITGYIEEIEMEDGEMGLRIDDGDHAYQIIMDRLGSKLRDHIDEEVDVTGLMTKTKDIREIKVKSFHPADDYYYDDDYKDDDSEYYA